MGHVRTPWRTALLLLFLASVGSFSIECTFAHSRRDLGAWHAVPLQESKPPQTNPNVHITILGTTDLHGHIEPLDYFTNKPAQWGLAKIATLVKQVRAEQPNVLLLDGGDTIQGTPLAYYFARTDTDKPNPMIVAMNALGYDAAAVGNHEFNFGLDLLWKVKREARFPILAANVKQKYANAPKRFEPYIVKEVGGVRVAIVGFVTPAIPHVEIPANYAGYEFEPIVDAARRVISEVRKRSDVVIVVSHSGLPSDPPWSDELSGENAMLELAQQVPGIDVILFGHTHGELAERTINGVLLTQPRLWGRSLARIDLDVSRDAGGHWRIGAKHSTVIPVTAEVPADPEIIRLAAPYELATQKYLDTSIATSAKEMRGTYSRFEDEPLLDLLHTVQRKVGHADVSMATMLFTGARIPAGRVTIRQIDSLYVYENFLYTVEMNGARLRAALEHSASLYQSWPIPSGQQLRLPDFNVDSASGVEYTIDLRQPVGHRIMDLRYKGKPLDDAQTLRVAINNYRYTGGGGYDFTGLPIVYRSTEEIRDLIVEYLTRTAVVPTTANKNWQIEPHDAVEALRRAAMEQEARAAFFEPKLFPGPATFATPVVLRRVNGFSFPEPQHNFDIHAGN
jgi:2',3'-cyclic-nucleotide 2'-phosphodiesterase/3'-nucleotidase